VVLLFAQNWRGKTGEGGLTVFGRNLYIGSRTVLEFGSRLLLKSVCAEGLVVLIGVVVLRDRCWDMLAVTLVDLALLYRGLEA
jgi:hypothetical protein